MDEIEEGNLTEMLQDKTIVEDQVTSAASQESEGRIKPEVQKESRSKLRITEEPTLLTTTSTTGSSGSENRKSGRLTKTVKKFYPFPGPRTPRIMCNIWTNLTLLLKISLLYSQ